MSYRPQLLLEKNQKYDFIGESKNCIPLFWSLIFCENQFTITTKEELYHPILKIDHRCLQIPESIFDGELLICWKDFTEVIIRKAKEGNNLVLDFADILEMNHDVDTLKTLEDVRKACQRFLVEMKVYFLRLGKNEKMTYHILLGMCNLSEVSEEKYQNLSSKPQKSRYTQNQRSTKKKSKTRIVIESILVLLVALLMTIYCIIMIISGKQILLGILGVLFFSVGIIFYGMKSFEDLKNSNS